MKLRKDRKEIRIREAKIRADAYAKLSTKEKIAKLDKLGAKETKQRARLQVKLASEKTAPKPKAKTDGKKEQKRK